MYWNIVKYKENIYLMTTHMIKLAALKLFHLLLGRDTWSSTHVVKLNVGSNKTALSSISRLLAPSANINELIFLIQED